MNVSTPADVAGRTTTDVGRIFQTGGDAGLILYALVLFCAFMFIVAIVAVWLGYRALHRKDEINTQQTKAFTEAMDRNADATTKLAQASATQTAVQANQTGTLARIEVLLGMLDKVP